MKLIFLGNSKFIPIRSECEPMNNRLPKTICISLLCLTLTLLPTSTAWGFGKGSQGSDVYTEPAPIPNNMPTPAPTGYPLTGLTAGEQQMIDLVNQARTKAGLHTLSADSALTHTARLKSQDMIKLNYFAHQSPTYGSPFDMMSQFGIPFQSAGENIACNQTVSAAHQALMNSQGHRDNILNPSFGFIGIGIVTGGPCGQMYTQEFVGR
jgi:uncharacterized YkwD family protein